MEDNTTTNNNLEYKSTWTIEQFKDLHKDSELNVVKNPNTGKLFFICGDVQGAVSKNVAEGTTPVVSEVADKATGEIFFMLHNRSNQNVVMTF